MAVRVGINGFGRIGRNVFRAATSRAKGEVEIVAVNDLTDAKTLAYLLKYDSVFGVYPGTVEHEGDAIIVDGTPIRVLAERDPGNLAWGDMGVDIVVESTGFFTKRADAAKHLEGGAKKVIISAPSKDDTPMFVFGVNHQSYAGQAIISNASCTTNCLAPLAKVLNDAIGIESGVMTTIHSYTGDQPTLDRRHKDLYRARAAAMAMIPTSTGAGKAIGEVLPELAGKLDGSAIRVPTPNVSAVDLTFVAGKSVTVEEVNEIIREASLGKMSAVLAYDPEPKVSIDFNHTPQSCIFAPDQTKVVGGRTVRVLAWYDNEWGFSCRMADVAAAMGRLLG